jgi:hypothetical protein
MKLERHVGGLSRGRKANYLRARGWEPAAGGFRHPRFGALPAAKAVHHQLTEDLCEALGQWGWKVVGYSDRGYAQLVDAKGGRPCSLPKALRTQARRQKVPVAELTYALFLAAVIQAAPR